MRALKDCDIKGDPFTVATIKLLFGQVLIGIGDVGMEKPGNLRVINTVPNAYMPRSGIHKDPSLSGTPLFIVAPRDDDIRSVWTDNNLVDVRYGEVGGKMDIHNRPLHGIGMHHAEQSGLYLVLSPTNMPIEDNDSLGI